MSDSLYKLRIELATPTGELWGFVTDFSFSVGQALDPLPRDREFLPYPHATAEEQMRMRQYLLRDAAKLVARELTEKLLPEITKVVEHRDTIQGYTREEFAKFQDSPTPQVRRIR